MIRAENVSYSYAGNTRTVSGLTFHIKKGEFVTLLGENGAGKTTTVKLIDGLLRPTGGTMTVCGLDTSRTRVSERARHVGFLFQNPDRQICQNTVRDEIAFGLKTLNGGKESDEIKRRVNEMLEVFGFAGTEEPFSLSRGQRQQAALASVIAVRPEVLILDEPTTGLDYRECSRIMDMIKRMNAEDGTTVVMVCHDMEVVLDYADRALVMAGGKLIGDGKVKDVFRDADLMEKASLLPPQITALSIRLGAGFEGIDDAYAMADAVSEMRGGRL